jgi:hypothetical protein
VSKILSFPTHQLLSKQALIEDLYSLTPEAKREVAARLVEEAASLLKTLSLRDAAIAELLIDCLRLTDGQTEDAYAEIQL